MLLVGNNCGTLGEEVRRKVKNLGLEEAVLFLGVRSDVADLMQAMDVFVLPSSETYQVGDVEDMDGEWKWSDWGNGEDGYEGYHRYPVSQGVEIQEIEVKF